MTGINVIGMPFGLHGLGMELRDKVRAMVGAGIDVCIVDRNYSSINRQWAGSCRGSRASQRRA